MPCWGPFEGHRYVYQKPTETFVFEFSYKCVNSLLKELIKVNILFWGKECSDSKIYRHRGFPCRQLMHCHTSYQSLTWAPIPMRPSLRHSIAYLYPCPTWPRTQLSGTYGNIQTYKKYMPVKVLLWSKFWLPFSFQLSKEEPQKDLELVGTRGMTVGMWSHMHILAHFYGRGKQQAILF